MHFNFKHLKPNSIALLRPQPQVDDLARQLYWLYGLPVMKFPLTKLNYCSCSAFYQQSLAQSIKYDLLVFFSYHAVMAFLQNLKAEPQLVNLFHQQTKLVAIGPATAKILQKVSANILGLNDQSAILLPSTHSSVGLVDLLSKTDLSNKRILLVHGLPSNSSVCQLLANSALEVSDMIVYQRSIDYDYLQLLATPAVWQNLQYIIVFSKAMLTILSNYSTDLLNNLKDKYWLVTHADIKSLLINFKICQDKQIILTQPNHASIAATISQLI